MTKYILDFFKSFGWLFILLLSIGYSIKFVSCIWIMITSKVNYQVKIKEGLISLIIVLVIIFFMKYELTYSNDANLVNRTTGDNSISKVAKEHIKSKRIPGVVIGIIDDNTAQILSYGYSSSNPINGDTVFEIGSISKLFTGLILANTVIENEISLNNNIGKFNDIIASRHQGITIRELVTHTSGLPKFSSEASFGGKAIISSFVGSNPYKNIGDKTLISLLNNTELMEDGWNYSNIGFATLGLILSEQSGKEYSQLVEEYIVDKIGMRNTYVGESGSSRRNFAQGYRNYIRVGGLMLGSRADEWTMNESINAMGGIKSSGNDMLNFLQYVIEDNSESTKLSKKTLYNNTDNDSLAMAMGWIISKNKINDKETVMWHNGETGGFSSYIGMVDNKKKGVVILANKMNCDIDSLGDKILKVMLDKKDGEEE